MPGDMTMGDVRSAAAGVLAGVAAGRNPTVDTADGGAAANRPLPTRTTRGGRRIVSLVAADAGAAVLVTTSAPAPPVAPGRMGDTSGSRVERLVRSGEVGDVVLEVDVLRITTGSRVLGTASRGVAGEPGTLMTAGSPGRVRVGLLLRGSTADAASSECVCASTARCDGDVCALMASTMDSRDGDG